MVIHYNANDTEGSCKAKAFSCLAVMPLLPYLAKQAELLFGYNPWKFHGGDNVIKQRNEHNGNGADAHAIT